MKIFFVLLFVGAQSLVGSVAHARVFELSNRNFATYFGGEVGASNLGKQAWGDSSGSTTTTDKPVAANFSGEFGVLFASQKLNFRLGLEYLQPQHRADVTGTNPSGTQLFTLDSTTRAIIPKATLEMVVNKGKESSLMFGASIGYAMVTMINDYAMTPASGLSDYEEKGEATSISGEGFIGYEFIFSDNVTILATAGYRYLLVDNLKNQNAVTTINGPVTKGSTVTNNNGESRTLNLSSANLGLNFRFYF